MDARITTNEYSQIHEKLKKVTSIQKIIIFTSLILIPLSGILLQSTGLTIILVISMVVSLLITTRYTKKCNDEIKNTFNNKVWENISQATTYNRSEEKVVDGEPKSKLGYLIDPNTVHAEIIVSDTVKNSINQGIGKIKHREFLYEKWNLKSIDKMDNKNIFNFYGLPGTGKTLSAIEVAKILNKKLFVVDYSQVDDKHVGESEKNISKIFAFAKKHDAIILLDEADSLVAKRIEATTANGQYLNSAKTVLMQELDKFNGIMILTTNLFQSFDQAILRRISQNVKFELPNQEMRMKIFKAHIPKEVMTLGLDYDLLAESSKYLSGGDIKNITREAMLKAINEADQSGDVLKACLSQNHLMEELNKVKETKLEYKNETKDKKLGI